jgi:hypothetical protein
MTKPPVIGRPSQRDRNLAKERHEPEYASPARTFSGETRRSGASKTGTSRPRLTSTTQSVIRPIRLLHSSAPASMLSAHDSNVRSGV